MASRFKTDEEFKKWLKDNEYKSVGNHIVSKEGSIIILPGPVDKEAAKHVTDYKSWAKWRRETKNWDVSFDDWQKKKLR